MWTISKFERTREGQLALLTNTGTVSNVTFRNTSDRQSVAHRGFSERELPS